MATPTKAITYLAGIYSMGQVVLPTEPPPVLVGLIASRAQVAPPLWRPIAYVQAQPRAGRVLVAVATHMQAFSAVKMTVFWRDASGRPKRGQLWPRTR